MPWKLSDCSLYVRHRVSLQGACTSKSVIQQRALANRSRLPTRLDPNAIATADFPVVSDSLRLTTVLLCCRDGKILTNLSHKLPISGRSMRCFWHGIECPAVLFSARGTCSHLHACMLLQHQHHVTMCEHESWDVWRGVYCCWESQCVH